MTSRVINRRVLLGASVAGLTGAGLLFYPPSATFAGENIDAVAAHSGAVSGSLFLIDIRRPDEWQATGIGQGAQPLDMRRDDFSAALRDLVQADTTTRIALICARGVRSARLAGRLTAAGFSQIINVPEGMLGAAAGPGWIARGLPVVRV